MTLSKKMILCIERAMKRAGIESKAEFARRAGISRAATISDIMDGTVKDPRLSTLQRLAKACGCTISELIGEDPMKK